jgi:hypothetical protein
MDDSSGKSIVRCRTLFEKGPEAMAVLTPVLDVNGLPCLVSDKDGVCGM